MRRKADEIKLDRLHQCTFEQVLELRNKGFEGYYTDMTITIAHSLAHPLFEADETTETRLVYGSCSDAAVISFYRHEAAWSCQGHNIQEGESLILTDSHNQAIAYALFRRKKSVDGEINSVSLYQCEADPARPDKPLLFRIILQQLFERFNGAYAKHVVNLSMSNPELIAMLKDVGFTTD